MNENEMRTIFQENIRYFRKLKGLTQMQLSELCEMSCMYIQKVESGGYWPSAVGLLKIINSLNIEPYQLFLPNGYLVIKREEKETPARLLDIEQKITNLTEDDLSAIERIITSLSQK